MQTLFGKSCLIFLEAMNDYDKLFFYRLIIEQNQWYV
ncbi:hypothetical protein SAMN05421692_1742 [Chryseobacterium indologenes]|nr:hypothetical protein SAMN05421692_1742 [Chryseobacterium indologenes]SUX53116.1 Uncharacterised protein [Chryseobacterium indologenes]